MYKKILNKMKKLGRKRKKKKKESQGLQHCNLCMRDTCHTCMDHGAKDPTTHVECASCEITCRNQKKGPKFLSTWWTLIGGRTIMLSLVGLQNFENALG